jgi:hypothetical protein
MKKFLTKNKIYFEIFSMIFLGVMALIVSFTQLRTSSLEYELHRAEKMPLFKIDYKLAKIDSTEFYDTEFLQVSNEGGIIKKFECKFNVFYEFTIQPWDNMKHSRTIYVPAWDFYGLTLRSGKLTGELMTAYSRGNNYYISEAERYCNKFLEKTKKFVSVRRTTVLKIDYTNINNEKHTVYLDTQGNEISENEYSQTERHAKDFQSGPYYMKEFTSRFIDSLVTSVN